MKKLLLVGSLLFLFTSNFTLSATEKNIKKEISFMIPEWGVPTQKMLDEFYKETGIKVNVETVAWDDLREKVSIAAVGKKAAADVMEVDFSFVGEYQKAGWLEPLKIEKTDISDMPSIASFIVNDKVLAVPYASDSRVGYYNKTLYSKAGLKEPNTWAEVEKQMLVIKEKGILKYPFTFPLNASEGTTTSFIWLTFLRDGKIFNDDNTLNKENALTSLEFLDRAIKNKLINPANLTIKDIDTYRQVITGQAAFMVGPTSFVGKSDPKVVGEIELILPPGKDGKAKQTMACTEAIGISSLSKNKEEALKFVQWYTSKKMQLDLYKELNITPTRKTVLNNLIDSGEIKNAGSLKEASSLVKDPFPNGIPSYYSEMSKVFCNAVNKMASGNATPLETFNEMDSKLKELIQNSK